MNERRATKRALLTSITALVMCVVMLAGTTFAWFTDTASTNVNKIQAGNLKVGIVDANDASLENQTLNWVKAQGGAGQDILWEPGATYELQPFYVKNEGNLAIRYEIKITGTQGDAKLLEAIEFYVNDATTPITSDSIGTGTLMPKGKTDSTSSAITIKGHMKESAKNEYQGLSLDGIAITVYATQANYEYDSSSDTYDSGAFAALADLYPVSKSVAIAKDASGNKQQAVISDVDTSSNKTYKVTVPGDAMADDADNISVTISKAASVDTANFSVTTGNKLEQFDVTVSGIKSGNDKQITVELFIGKGYAFMGGVPVKHLMKDGHVENLTGTYNASNGCVTFETTSFSPFAVEVPDMAAAIGAGHELTYYYTLSDAVAAAENGATITLLRDANGDGITVQGGKVFTLDFGGHSYTVDGKPTGSEGTESQAFQLLTGSTIVFKNGKIIGDTPGVRMLIQNYCDLTLDNMTLDATVGNNNVSYSMSNNCGIVTIKDTTITAKANSVAFDVYGGFGSYDNVTVTVDGNSVINGDIELARDTGSSNTNTNTLMLKNCTINGNILKSDGTLNFAGNVTLNGDVNVTDMTDTVANCTTVTEKTTLNLNGKIITPNNMGNNNKNFTALIVDADTTINAGVNGGIDTQTNGGYGINVRRGATLTINGGTYYGGGTAVQVQKGTLVINDGTFEVEPYSDPTYGYKYLINCIDAAWKNGTAKIAIKGGTFVNFDPADSASENPRGNFVAEGYKVVSAEQSNGDTWYTVVPIT